MFQRYCSSKNRCNVYRWNRKRTIHFTARIYLLRNVDAKIPRQTQHDNRLSVTVKITRNLNYVYTNKIMDVFVEYIWESLEFCINIKDVLKEAVKGEHLDQTSSPCGEHLKTKAIGTAVRQRCISVHCIFRLAFWFLSMPRLSQHLRISFILVKLTRWMFYLYNTNIKLDLCVDSTCYCYFILFIC